MIFVNIQLTLTSQNFASQIALQDSGGEAPIPPPNNSRSPIRATEVMDPPESEGGGSIQHVNDPGAPTTEGTTHASAAADTTKLGPPAGGNAPPNAPISTDSANPRPGEEGAAESSARKRRRKKGSNISRKKKGGKSKRHRQGAVVESFRGNTPRPDLSPSLPAESAAKAADPTTTQLRALRNKMDYQKRKAEKDRDAVVELKGKVQSLESDKLELEKASQSYKQAAAKHEKEVEKNLRRLNDRTDRFTKFAEKKQAELTRARSGAKRTAAALKKQHDKELKQLTSTNFKQCRDLSKKVTLLESEVESVKFESVKAKADCDEKVEAME